MSNPSWDGLPSRPYVEAYPRIDIVAAQKGWRIKSPLCVWRNQNGHQIGAAVVDWPSVDRMVAEIRINDADIFQASDLAIDVSIVFQAAGRYSHRSYASCPGCERISRDLIYKNDRWLCVKCQGLVNRTTIISQDIRRSERLRLLNAEIDAGRPSGMHHKTFLKKEVKRASLARMLGGRNMVASTSYCDVISCTWHPFGGYGLHLFSGSI